MRQRGTSLDIRTGEDYTCTVLFLWNKRIPQRKEEEEEEEEEERQ